MVRPEGQKGVADVDGKNLFVERLDQLIGAYLDDPGEDRLYAVICALFEGIHKNCAVPCPVKMGPDEAKCELALLRKKDGREHMAVFTQQDGGEYPVIAELQFQGLVEALADLDNCEGIIFNPFAEHRLFVPKELFMSALAAGFSMALKGAGEEEKEPDEQGSGNSLENGNSVKVRRPVEEEEFRLIEQRVRNLTEDEDDFVIMDLIEDEDDMLFIRTIRHGEQWYMELAFDMSDFDWEGPLILGAELDLETAVLLLEQMLVHGVSPDDISMIQTRFRDIGFHGSESQA